MVAPGECDRHLTNTKEECEVYSGQESPLSETRQYPTYFLDEQRVCKCNILFCKSICNGRC